MNLQQKNLIEKLMSQGQSLGRIKKIFRMDGMSETKVDKLLADYESGATPTKPSVSKPRVSKSSSISPPKAKKMRKPVKVSTGKVNSRIPDPIGSSRDRAQIQEIGRTEVPELKQGGGRKIGVVIGILLLVLLAGTAAFAYMQKIGPFAGEAYTEENIMQGIFSKVTGITSADTKVSMRLFVEERDADAAVFIPVVGDSELQEQLERDAQRFETVVQLGLMWLDTYPETLSEALEGYSEDLLNDPRTEEAYLYKSTKDGTGYELTVEFETSEALATIIEQETYDWETGEFLSNMIQVLGNVVVFTEEDESQFGFNAELPKTTFEEWGDMALYLPPELDVEGQVSFASDWRSEGELAQWKFNLGGEGDFGDLTYKVGVDMMKKETDYFLRINNFPDLFFSNFLPEKGRWFSVNAEEGEDVLDNFGVEVSRVEGAYTSEREGVIAIMKEIIRLSDKHRLFSFKESPQREKVNEQNLTRYSLGLNKAALDPFYRDLKAYAENIETEDEVVREFVQDFVDNDTFLEYIQTVEFDVEFDYLDKNSTFTLWTDSAGYPAMIELQNRIVPNDDADNQKLKNKQVKFILSLELGGINNPVDVVVPEGISSLVDHMDLILESSEEESSDGLELINMDTLEVIEFTTSPVSGEVE